MTEDDLKQIEIRKRLAVVPNVHDTIGEASARHVIERDTPALIAEVRRLRDVSDTARGALADIAGMSAREIADGVAQRKAQRIYNETK